MNKLIVALDVNTFAKAKKLVDELSPHVNIFKVGTELFTSTGPKIVDYINKKHKKVFLDLKFYDIPNTVGNSVLAAARQNVFMLTLHASGGPEMLKKAVSALEGAKKRPKLLGVTVLTSKKYKNAARDAAKLAKLAKKAGLDGCIASPKETGRIKKACGKKFIVVNPGIRPSWAVKADDQKRVTTPREAIENGADFIVVGRPITQARNQVLAAKKIVEETAAVEEVGMLEKEILAIFKKTGAMLRGHFKLSSGLHSAKYLQCARVLEHPEYAEKLCKMLAEKFRHEKPDIVIAPALGGVIVSYEVARALKARSLFTERIDGKMALRRGFELNKRDKVLVVEDVITTGLSTGEVMEIVKSFGSEIVGVGCIIDRSGGKADPSTRPGLKFGACSGLTLRGAIERVNFGVKFASLAKINIPTFEPAKCPLCAKGEPIIKPGSRNCTR